ncbi:MAG: hypothetical protein WD887_02815 [Candidatus Saccharimonadales bacterium]
MRQWLKRWATVQVAGLAGILPIALVFLAVPAVMAATFVQGFSSEETLEQGTVVALSPTNANVVVPASVGNESRIYGVVVQSEDAPVVISDEDKQVLVATEGEYPVLVSVRDGTIRAGDYLFVSPTDGIATRATAEQDVIVGRALTDFNGQQDVVRQEGGFNVGRVSAAIGTAENPLKKSASNVPPAIRELSEGIAGKQVSPLRIYAAMVIFAVAALSAFSLLLAGVRNGMVAIGRNPLSRNSIFRSLLQVAMTSILVLLVGVLGVYLILKI